jgi:ribosomal protein S18 acetylase RimI-like enzyme
MKIDHSCPMLYRLYMPEDFAALYAIEEACFQPPHRFSRAYMRQLIQQSNAATWIAEDDERMCGFALVEWTQEAAGVVAYLQTLEVIQRKRGQGVGSELLRQVENSASAASASVIWLHVDAKNEPAIRVYQAQGFVLQGREEDYYGRGRPALVYAKPLGEASSH